MPTESTYVYLSSEEGGSKTKINLKNEDAFRKPFLDYIFIYYTEDRRRIQNLPKDIREMDDYFRYDQTTGIDTYTQENIDKFYEVTFNQLERIKNMPIHQIVEDYHKKMMGAKGKYPSVNWERLFPKNLKTEDVDEDTELLISDILVETKTLDERTEKFREKGIKSGRKLSAGGETQYKDILEERLEKEINLTSLVNEEEIEISAPTPQHKDSNEKLFQSQGLNYETEEGFDKKPDEDKITIIMKFPEDIKNINFEEKDAIDNIYKILLKEEDFFKKIRHAIGKIFGDFEKLEYVIAFNIKFNSEELLKKLQGSSIEYYEKEDELEIPLEIKINYLRHLIPRIGKIKSKGASASWVTGMNVEEKLEEVKEKLDNQDLTEEEREKLEKEQKELLEELETKERMGDSSPKQGKVFTGGFKQDIIPEIEIQLGAIQNRIERLEDAIGEIKEHRPVEGEK